MENKLVPGYCKIMVISSFKPWLHISVAIIFAGFVAFTSSCKEALYQIFLREAERHKTQKNSLNGVQRVFL